MSFRDYGLSEATLSGLDECGYKEPTDIQQKALPLALEGRDLLGAARTGSGKTLAFLVPVLERLDSLKWSKVLGLAALIITPTRELAYQIYQVLRKIGKHHSFSAALIIGGKDLKYETPRMRNINIIIATPGRMVQHMEQNPELDCSDLQVLVLDEADRLLEMGFAPQLDALIENLPPAGTRQTLLFSATQTRSVKDLARLSLSNPVFVSAEEDEVKEAVSSASQSKMDKKFVLPIGLQQIYMVVSVEDKLRFLWSFLAFHKQSKLLIFLASCKQVKYYHEVLCHLRPGLSVMALHGKQHQLKRLQIYESFHRKKHAALLATDVAARGLDFPGVDYVIQIDCPDDVVGYVHRAGRTARYNAKGVAILLVTPAEEKSFVPQLAAKSIDVECREANPRNLRSLQLESLLAKFPQLKESAQRAFRSYLKSLHMVGKLDNAQINMENFAASLGLHLVPRVRFMLRKEKNSKNVKWKSVSSTKNHISGFAGDLVDNDEVLIPKKPVEKQAEEDSHEILPVPEREDKKRFVSKVGLAKRLVKKGIIKNTRIKFGEDGEVISMEGPTTSLEDGARGLDIQQAAEAMKVADKEDRMAYRERIREKHRLERKKIKERRRKPGHIVEGAQEGGVLLADYEPPGESITASLDHNENVMGKRKQKRPEAKEAEGRSKKRRTSLEDLESVFTKKDRKHSSKDDLVKTDTSSKKNSKHVKFVEMNEEELALQLLSAS